MSPVVVIVATADIDRSALAGVVSPDDELHIVIAAVEQSRLQWLANDEGDARDDAESVGRQIERNAPTDTADVVVSPDAPSQVVRDAIAEHSPDRVIVAIRDSEDATWLEEGELAEVPTMIDGVPVTRVRL